MTTSRATRILLSLPLFLAAAAFAGHAPVQEEVTAEEYAVYRAVLDDSLFSASGHPVVVMDRVEVDRSTPVNAVDARIAGAPGSVVEDYRARSRRPALLRAAGFGAERPVRVVSRAGRDSILQAEGHAAGGPSSMKEILGFSRVGFSADGTMAVLTLSRICASLCGTGHLVWLERREGRWRVTSSRILWIS